MVQGHKAGPVNVLEGPPILTANNEEKDKKTNLLFYMEARIQIRR